MKQITIISLILTNLLLVSSVSAQLNNSWTAYPPPNITSIGGIFTYDNTVTSGLFVSMLIFSLWIILLILTSRTTGITPAFTTASLIALVLSLLLRVLGNTNSVGDNTIVIFIVMTVIGIALSFKGGGQ
jgi:hypothetical protein